MDQSAVQAIIDVAQEADKGEVLEAGNVYAFRTRDGRVETVDLTGDRYHDSPRRKTGTTVVRDAPSFLAYWRKHSDSDSDIYADRDARKVTAVIDANGVDQPRFGVHRLVLQLKHTDSFDAWSARSGKLMNQTAFAEFLEDHRADIQSPPAADLLELAQTFQATTKVTFRSGTALKSGQRQLQYVEETNASAGSKGQITIPDEFQLALRIFEGAEVADAVTARLRYRIDSDGKLGLLFILDQLSDVVNAAFEGVVDQLAGGVSVPILRGTPA
jgi:uncharacterized protein YfdQ (DUF2303 family)